MGVRSNKKKWIKLSLYKIFERQEVFKMQFVMSFSMNIFTDPLDHKVNTLIKNFKYKTRPMKHPEILAKLYTKE